LLASLPVVETDRSSLTAGCPVAAVEVLAGMTRAVSAKTLANKSLNDFIRPAPYFLLGSHPNRQTCHQPRGCLIVPGYTLSCGAQNIGRTQGICLPAALFPFVTLDQNIALA
jgi:hypothetical protein